MHLDRREDKRIRSFFITAARHAPEIEIADRWRDPYIVRADCGRVIISRSCKPLFSRKLFRGAARFGVAESFYRRIKIIGANQPAPMAKLGYDSLLLQCRRDGRSVAAGSQKYLADSYSPLFRPIRFFRRSRICCTQLDTRQYRFANYFHFGLLAGINSNRKVI